MADRFCCIAGGMYRYDEEPDGRQLYVTLEEHQKLVETVEFLDSAIRAEHPNWAAIFERLDSVCDRPPGRRHPPRVPGHHPVG